MAGLAKGVGATGIGEGRRMIEGKEAKKKSCSSVRWDIMKINVWRQRQRDLAGWRFRCARGSWFSLLTGSQGGEFGVWGTHGVHARTHARTGVRRAAAAIRARFLEVGRKRAGVACDGQRLVWARRDVPRPALGLGDWQLATADTPQMGGVWGRGNRQSFEKKSVRWEAARVGFWGRRAMIYNTEKNVKCCVYFANLLCIWKFHGWTHAS